jgi:hypothetical protein
MDAAAEKPKKVRKLFKVLGNVGKGIVRGVLDTALPNLKDSIKMKEPDLPDEKKKFEFDVPRLITAVTIWILLVLVFFGKIKFSDVVDLIDKLLN